MELKYGVKIKGIQPEIVLACMLIKDIVDRYRPFVVTSVVDGKHSDNSLHYSGNAVDVRIYIGHTL